MKGDEELAFLAGGGEMGERIRGLDWSRSPVGPPARWPASLKTAVSICLGSRHPIVVWWGNPAYTQFYNDAYIPYLGTHKHPACLGRSGRECWSEIWPTIGPMLEGVYASGEATWSEDLLLVLDRNLPREEAYFTFSYGPIRGDNGAIGGIFCACNETTGRVLGERRLRTLRDLSRMEAEAKTPQEACEVAVRTLAENPADIPFALTYLVDEEGRYARLVASTGFQPASQTAPDRVDLQRDPELLSLWPLRRVLDTAAPELVAGLPARFGALPGGPWPEAPQAALTVPIGAPGKGVTGFLVAGLSPRRVVDADYRSFFDLVAGHIGTSIANARAYEEERKRAEALAEIDRAKTAFFSNVSHEFRTPLTLMMGPLEEVLAQSADLPAAGREQLELAHRNSLRLLKLVNTLLDFSRIEAGRIQASYEPIELAGATAELASVFRSAVERAGMKLIVDCPLLTKPVYVDREMWEKIVLNLVSNAFKFTFDGEIEVSLREAQSAVELTVRDTGTGIPSDEIPRLFERFHRVSGARGRSYEGSGIGLALVHELVRLHGGEVRVESAVDRGSRFIVSLPIGKAHLPAERIQAARSLASTGVRAQAYVEEASRWLPAEPRTLSLADEASLAALAGRDGESPRHLPRSKELAGRRILLADDNADMRGYVGRLLAQSGYEVEPASDGFAALEASRRRKPDLVLTDVMMPGLDGFGLLRELRADPRLADIPIILISARAGEEARIEGMQAGADDYLIKPFSARELLARVQSHLSMARFRFEASQKLRFRTSQFETLLNQAPIGVYLVDAEFRIREANPTALAAFGDIPGGMLGRDFREVVRIIWQRDHADEMVRIFEHTLKTGEPHIAAESAEVRADRKVTEYYEWRLDRIVLPDGRHGAVCYFRDISQRVQADHTRQLLLNELNHRVKNTLASVQAIAQQTLKNTKNPADFAGRFSGRIHSLARVHSLLTDTNWQGADLRTLILDQLFQGPADEARVTAWGPAIRLGPQTALHMALMLHELGTNGAKYGALSTSAGWVAVSWTIKDHVLRLRWVERGGPSVTAPIARGFGTTLIEQSAKSEGGTAVMLCEAEGITWEIDLPLPAREPAQPSASAAPSQSAAAQQNENGNARPQAMLARLRCLLVEDEPLIALDLADSLQHAGAATVTSVGTEREALKAVEDGEFDAALLDANLHGRSSQEIAAALTRRGIPFIFVTGYAREGLPASFRHAPVLVKPVSDSQLIEAVKRLVPNNAVVVRLKS
ncbi:MAG TPA: response regulator [Xanthobacteraceae bacterium]|jgi:PAS domain S-box-containing protein